MVRSCGNLILAMSIIVSSFMTLSKCILPAQGEGKAEYSGGEFGNEPIVTSEDCHIGKMLGMIELYLFLPKDATTLLENRDQRSIVPAQVRNILKNKRPMVVIDLKNRIVQKTIFFDDRQRTITVTGRTSSDLERLYGKPVSFEHVRHTMRRKFRFVGVSEAGLICQVWLSVDFEKEKSTRYEIDLCLI